MPIIREPQDSLLTVHPGSTACWLPWVCEPLWDWCNATTELVLRKCLLAECTFEACISGQGGTSSSPCWDPAKVKWQLFLERSLTNSLWQWLLILQALSKSLFALQEIKCFSAWHPSELFFFPLQRGIHQLLISSHFHFLPGSSAHHFLFIKLAWF